MTLLTGAIALGSGMTSAQTPATPATAPASRVFGVAWRQPVAVPGVPLVAAGASGVFVVSDGAGLAAYAPADGQKMWDTSLTALTRPAVLGTRVAVVSSGVLHVLDQTTGRVLWQADVGLSDPAATVSGLGDLFIATVGTDLRAWGRDGSEAWRCALEQAPTTRPVLEAGIVYIGVDSPELISIDAGSGVVRGRVRLPARATSLTAHSGRLYFSGADGALYSYRTAGGLKAAWRYRLVDAVGEPVVDDRQLYVALLDNTLRAFDRQGGSQRWSRQLPSRPAGGPVLSGGDVLVALTTGHLVQAAAMTGASPTAPGGSEPAGPRVRLLGVAQAPDGSTVYTVVAGGDNTRTLLAWRAPAPAG